MGELERAQLARAARRLATLDFYPRPVRMGRVRILHAPWLFRLPPWRRYDGFATHRVIFLRHPGVSDDLVTHELCHVWQMQHRPLHVVLTYLTTRYRRNPYELEARRAVELTR